MTSGFAGCHGVRIDPPEAGGSYGWTDAAPFASLHLGQAGVTVSPAAVELWRADLVGWAGGVERDATHVMWRDGATLTLTIGGQPVMSFDPEHGEAVVGEVSEAAAHQLVTTFAVPAVARRAGLLVVHAATIVRRGRALLVCAASGTGKSSVLIALCDAGWEPLSEDLVAVEFTGEGVRAWPGPPWVRVEPGAPGPAGAPERFTTPDKVAWDLEGRMHPGPAAVAGLVLLEPATDQPTERASVPPAAAIAALGLHTPWIEEPGARAGALFPPIVRLARAVPTTRLRLQRSTRWRAEAVEVMDQVASAGAPAQTR